MRHRKLATKLGRTSAHRKALYRNLVTALLEHERIETTDAKAKQVRRLADRMITLGKRGTLHARRRALRVIRSRQVAGKVFDELADRYAERPGGYTRVLKVRDRVGDAAPISIVELVDGVPGGLLPRGAGKKEGAAAKAGKPAREKAVARKPEAKGAEEPKTAKKAKRPRAAKTAKPAKTDKAAKTAKKARGRGTATKPRKSRSD